jgi:hypothetical protein
MKDVPLENIANGLKVSTGAKIDKKDNLYLKQHRDISRCGTRAILGGTANVANGQAVNRDIAANLDEQQNKLTVLQRKIVQE